MIFIKIYNEIANIAEKHGATKVILFGSRARKDNTSNSDIDIAVYGINNNNSGMFWHDIEEIPTLLKIDIVYIDTNTDELLLENIKRDGIIIMDKYNKKFSNFKKAVERLKEGIAEYDVTHSTTTRDGVIQRFEFCTELAWKTLRQKLIDEGLYDINSPKAVLKESFSLNLIKNERMWLNVLADINATSHIYDEQKADRIFKNIKNDYLNLFEILIVELS